MKLEFDSDLGYVQIIDRKHLILEDYLCQPIVRWLHENVGPMRWPKDVNEILRGDGWEISADWTVWMYNRSQKPRTYVILHKDIDSRLLTEFWMRFQR